MKNSMLHSTQSEVKKLQTQGFRVDKKRMRIFELIWYMLEISG
jgi:hypothetical protein